MYSKMQGRVAWAGNGLQALHALLGDDDDLAVLDVADEAGPDDVERAGLGGQDVVAVEFAEHQRADAERVARADQLLVGQADEGIGALDLAQRLDEAVDEALLAACAPRDGGSPPCRRSTGRSRRRGSSCAAERQAVGQVAVMGDGEAAAVELGEERLHVAQDRLAGRGVAHVADGARGPAGGRWSRCSEKWSPTRPSARSEWKRLPSKATMPAASWPRCCSACRPSAVMAAASGWPKMPKTPHSSRSRSASRSKVAGSSKARSAVIGGTRRIEDGSSCGSFGGAAMDTRRRHARYSRPHISRHRSRTV